MRNFTANTVTALSTCTTRNTLILFLESGEKLVLLGVSNQTSTLIKTANQVSARMKWMMNYLLKMTGNGVNVSDMTRCIMHPGSTTC